MAFVPGIVGAFFKPLAWTIVISLLFSLIVAITIVPLMSKVFLLKMSPKEHEEGALQKAYRKSLQWVLHHRAITLVLATVASCGIRCIYRTTAWYYLPAQEKMNDYDVNVTMEKGTAPDITNEIANEVENILLEQDEVELVSTNVRGQS